MNNADMNHTDIQNCNIIRDLLPSYLDNLCTADTRQAVEGHLSQCSTCQALADMMHTAYFVTEQTESAEIDYLKKVRKHFIKKESCIAAALTASALLGLYLSFSKYGYPAIKLCYLLLPCMLICTNMLFPSYLLGCKTPKSQKTAVAAGILLTCYGIFIHFHYLTNGQVWSSQDYGPFHLKPAQLGPFLSTQFLVIALYLTVLYLYGIYRTIHRKTVSCFYMNIYLTCGFITLGENLTLKTFSPSLAAYQKLLIWNVLIFLLEGMVLTGFLYILKKKACR